MRITTTNISHMISHCLVWGRVTGQEGAIAKMHIGALKGAGCIPYSVVVIIHRYTDT
jgi:hypothetical protein